MSDVATALTSSLANDGQTLPVANLPMGGFKHTGVGSATASDQYMTAGQAVNSTFQYLSSVSGADTIVASGSLAPSAYVAGQVFIFIAAGTNTVTPTINIGGLGAKSIKKRMSSGKTNLVAGDILSGVIYSILYDGTDFIINNIRYDSRGADIASAATVNLLTSTGNFVHITGTTGISAWTMGVGQFMDVIFDGILTLTHNATTNNLPSAANINTAANDRARLFYDGTIVWCVAYTRADGTSLVSPAQVSVQGLVKNLIASANGTSANVTETSDEIVLESASNTYVTTRNSSVTGALTASGANGLDDSAPQTVTVTIASPGVFTLNNHGFVANSAVVLATSGALPTGLTAGTTYYVVSPTANTFQLSATKGGSAINTSGTQSGAHTVKSVLAASTWYSRWRIWNGTTEAMLFSSSATNPVMPSGYTHKARTGWVYTDSSGNKYPLAFKQNGRTTEYIVAPSTNVTAFPLFASGVNGSATTPTWVAVSVSGVVPPTASRIQVLCSDTSNSAVQSVAANGNFGNNTSPNPAPIYCNPFAAGSLSTWIGLQSNNVYVGASSSTSRQACIGWEDNL